MATVQVYTAARMKAIEDTAIDYGYLSGNDLILRRHNLETINLGSVRGPKGDKGDTGDVTAAQLAVVDAKTIANAANITTVTNKLALLARGPGCEASIGYQVVSSGTFTDMVFDSEARDTDSYHSTVSNKDRITIPTGLGGLYAISAVANFGSYSVGSRTARMTINGSSSSTFIGAPAPDSNATIMSVYTELTLTAGDIVRLQLAHTAGGPLATAAVLRVRLVALP